MVCSLAGISARYKQRSGRNLTTYSSVCPIINVAPGNGGRSFSIVDGVHADSILSGDPYVSLISEINISATASLHCTSLSQRARLR